ncbi:MAG: mannose-1-phosphate guanylyltransferase [Ignavibacteriaceae bacterium]|nr:mannose-1-phosphate guanylyltransferase [Ignavibacteria bacterium]NNL21263.1 mannose-1-phosphate guanylyltransferase [Ignavibacteriaceae bacterium]
MKLYAVIMAGGVGSRFWPRSKKKTPKQLLRIFGERTMIQDTVKRIAELVPIENILIVTNREQTDGIISQLPELPEENIIIEPFGRNTAACIGLASVVIQSKDPEAITFVLPADHVIQDTKAFIKTIRTAAEFAEKKSALVTIGIEPRRPETGYGYIQIDESAVDMNVCKVLTFAEKPNYSTAVRFIESGDFYWNSGMFIWKVEAIFNEIKEHMPDLYTGLIKIKEKINSTEYESSLTNIYGHLRNISIDYGIMENSDKVFLVKGNFSWSDVGSWEAVYQLGEKDEDGNVKIGATYLDMVHDSYIYSPNKFAAVIGLDNIVVINDDDALLVCKMDKSQDVKKVIDHLKLNKLNDYI